NEGELELAPGFDHRRIPPGLARLHIVGQRLPDMPVNMERLIEDGTVVDLDDHCLTAVEGLPWMDPQPGNAVEGPGIALLQQAPEVELFAIELGACHAALLSALDDERNRSGLSEREIGCDGIRRKHEIVGQADGI